MIVWDVESGLQTRSSIQNPCYMNFVSFDQDGTGIICGGKEGTLCTWEVETMQLQFLIDGGRPNSKAD